MNLDAAKAVVEECKGVATAADLRIEAIHVDVALSESVQQATEYMVKTFGRIDYCVNSAGVSAPVATAHSNV
jgi:NAD(P)-dependent dehydrogenase (short-subunit alcohol dehydrogenase family)